MKHPKKIQAFTLSEVLVVLVITTIVIALAFSVLSLVSKQLGTIRTNYETRTTIAKFKQRLLLDFDRSDHISWDGNTGLLEIQYDDDVITYEFVEKNILRSGDTIALEIKNTNLYRKGFLVEEGMIDAMQLGIAQPGNIVELFVSRTLGAQEQLSK